VHGSQRKAALLAELMDIIQLLRNIKEILGYTVIRYLWLHADADSTDAVFVLFLKLIIVDIEY
jgi:hypothetical protein